MFVIGINQILMGNSVCRMYYGRQKTEETYYIADNYSL